MLARTHIEPVLIDRFQMNELRFGGSTESPLLYLCSVYKRCAHELKSQLIASREEKKSLFTDIQQCAVSWIGLLIQTPDMFGPKPSILPAYELYDLLERGEVQDDLIGALFVRFQSDSLQEVFLPVFQAFVSSMSRQKLLESTPLHAALKAFHILTSRSDLARVVSTPLLFGQIF